MNDSSNEKLNGIRDDEIDLADLFYVLWDKKLYIGGITSILALISIIYSLSLPNIYKSEAVMLPVQKESSASGLGGLSKMINLDGLGLSNSSGSTAKEAMARIESFDFFSNYFLPNINLEDLMAVQNWNSSNNTLTYDSRLYDQELRKWVKETSSSVPLLPSSQEAYKTYRKIMSIAKSKEDPFVYLSVEHQSPYLAQRWVELIITSIDLGMRDQAKQEANKAIEYLNTVAPTINYEEVRLALSALQQEQIKRLMTVEASENYIFKVLDSPIASETRFKPIRSVMVIVSTLIGMMISILLFLALHYRRKKL